MELGQLDIDNLFVLGRAGSLGGSRRRFSLNGSLYLGRTLGGLTYQSETKTVSFQGKSIVLESLTPVLSPKEKEKRKKDIERCLYEVFSKYRKAGDSPA